MSSVSLGQTRKLGDISKLLGLSDGPLEVGDDIDIKGMSHSSSDISEGDLFIALPGAHVHGSMFALDAKNRGARAILTDEEGARIRIGLPVLVVQDPRRMAGVVSAWFYKEPMRDMYSVGITGTNGKTTTTTLLQQLWTGAGRQVGLIGTVETRIGDILRLSKRTTPESSDLQRLAAEMRNHGVMNFVMEVSSHAISLERIRGSHFAVVAFTNLTQDHLDFHDSMENYFKAKAKLFSFEFADKAFINVDDAFGERLSRETELPVTRVSRLDKSADWHFVSVINEAQGMQIAVRGPGGVLIEGLLPLHGDFNLDNALMAIALAHDSAMDPIEISTLLPELVGAHGRLESVNSGQNFLAFVDYAHSPDAVSRVLETCRHLTEGKVIAVLGCGGDRDASKRILMGTALLNYSDVAVFTSDNPRSEDPMAILSAMTHGLQIIPPSQVIPDREAAINYAVSRAQEGDLVVVLGKGHELGQEINGDIFPFDDRAKLREAIVARR